MEYKKLGSTSVKVAEIGVGTWRYQGGPESLRAAIAAGATHIDTAERYGTEHIVGEAIAGLRKDVFLATKVRHENLRYNDVLAAADNSLKALGVDQIDLYQVHRPNPDVPIGETMRALDELVAAGKIRYIGVSNFSVAQLVEAQACTTNRIVSNQLRYSLVDRSIEQEMLPYCQQNDITLIAYSPLARGLDALRYAGKGDGLQQVARMEGRSQAQVALNWCISRENVVAIPRASSLEHVADVCAASGWRLTPESIALLDKTYPIKG